MLAVKRNDQNATIRELQHPNNSEENVQHIMTSSQAVPIHCGDTEVLQGRSVLNDSGDQNDNNLSRYTSAKNDCSDPGENSTSMFLKSVADRLFEDFDSDDTDADPNFVAYSSDSSSTSNSQSAQRITKSKQGGRKGKSKVLFPCKSENKTRKTKRNVDKCKKKKKKKKTKAKF
ncbi:uncharacterized protein LOC126162474 isoform X1 [Schistocerca cancellata]|uniref:uncharacterized protein LOC126162474 isoform X1 n=1 Tax=Schistocerca cancellata TaxID=274614 RepID=UPI0021178A30|nr:uncharacterized protein LOC126162474 isoform X1 [Schistocerca cancellata]XP_049774966.1 uncharacterized protein LOC126162474 isoform X1 [Schistocerca cancellata]